VWTLAEQRPIKKVDRESDTSKPRVLFVCTGNACRSQMAEGLLRRLAPERFESLSAGVQPAGFVHRFTRKALEEVGGYSPEQHSKSIHDMLPPHAVAPDLVITLCEYACRQLGKLSVDIPQLYWPVPDPIAAQGTEDERIAAFRWVRDKICIRLEDALDTQELETAIARQAPAATSARVSFDRLLSFLIPPYQTSRSS